MTLDELCRKLGGAGLCQGMSEDEIAQLARAGRVEEAAAEAVLMKEGSVCESLMIVLEGEVEVLKESEAGQDHRLALVGEGAFLGEVGLLESVPRTATARSTQPVRYFHLERSVFDELISQNDAAALKLSVAIARSLALRLKQMNERMLDLLDEVQPGRMPPELSSFRERLLEDWDF